MDSNDLMNQNIFNIALSFINYYIQFRFKN